MTKRVMITVLIFIVAFTLVFLISQSISYSPLSNLFRSSDDSEVEGTPYQSQVKASHLPSGDSLSALTLRGVTGNPEDLAKRQQQLFELLEEGRVGEVLRVLYDAQLADSIRRKNSNAAELVEKKVSNIAGIINHIKFDDFEHGIAHHMYELEMNGVTKEVHFEDDESAERINSGQTLTVDEGYLLGDHLIVPKGKAHVSDGLSFIQLSHQSLTARKAAIILINFQNAQTQPITPQQALDRVFGSSGAKKFYEENSFGQETFIGHLNSGGDVFGWYTVPYTNTNCSTNYGAWSAAARNFAVADGFNSSNYNFVLYVFSSASGCPYSAWAVIGGGTGTYSSWYGSASNFNGYIIDHELGHNHGFHHASSYTCTSNGQYVQLSSNCTYGEYGDPFDVMGSGKPKQFNSFNKGRTVNLINWLESANKVTVPSGSGGVYTLLPIEEASNDSITSLRIPRAVNGGTSYSYLYLEFRKIYGYDNFAANSLVVNGVTLRLASDYATASHTYLIDTVPGGSFSDAPLLLGNVFNDPLNNITITTTNVVPNVSASVNVDFGSLPCVHANPTITINPTSQWGYPGDTKIYTVTVTNKDNSVCGSSTFQVNPTLPVEFTQSPSTFSISLAPGAQQSTSISVTSSPTTVPDLYTFTETATNTNVASFVGSASANYNVNALDTTSPTVTIVQPQNGVTVSGGTFSIRASATDNVGVINVKIYVNNVLKKTCNYNPPVTSTSICQYNQRVNQLTNGANTITTTATDISNNVGDNSITVYK